MWSRATRYAIEEGRRGMHDVKKGKKETMKVS